MLKSISSKHPPSSPSSSVSSLASLSSNSSTLSTVINKRTTTTQNYLVYHSSLQQQQQQSASSSLLSLKNEDQKLTAKNSSSSTIESSSSGVCWSRALAAYYAAIFSGSNLGDTQETLQAIRTVVRNITNMPLHPAARVLSSLGSLSEESPLTYGPHCIEAVTNAASSSSSSSEIDEKGNDSTMANKKLADAGSSPPHYHKKRVILLPSHQQQQQQQQYRSPMFKLASDTMSRHRYTLVESSHRIACKAVTNCMSEGRWDAAISIATQIPSLIRFTEESKNRSSNDEGENNNFIIRGRTRTTCRGGSVHLGAYVEALNQAVKQDQQKALSTLLQVIDQQQHTPPPSKKQQQKSSSANNNDDASSSSAPTFYLSGLTPVDLKHMLMSFKQSDQGWRIASLLFSSRKYSIQNSSNKKTDETTATVSDDDTDRQGLLLDPAVINASLTVLGTQNKWHEAAKIISFKVSSNNNNKKTMTENHQNDSNNNNNSAIISTATRVLRHSPWNLALQLISKLCVNVVDHQAASDVATMVLRVGQNANWEHAASSFALLQSSSSVSSARSSSSSISSANSNNDKYYHRNHHHSHSRTSHQTAAAASLTIEAILSSRLTVKLLNEGKIDLASRALRHVRATGDANSLSGALNAFVLKSKSIRDCDTWITTMIEEGLAPSRNAREHVIRLFCQEGDWSQALCAVRDLDVPITNNSENNSFDELLEGEEQSHNHSNSNNNTIRIASAEKRERIISPLTHVYLQRSLKLSKAPWDVAVQTFIEVEKGNSRSFPDQDEKAVQQVAEAFRSVVGTCMEQKKEAVAQDLLSIMIQKGVGRR